MTAPVDRLLASQRRWDAWLGLGPQLLAHAAAVDWEMGLHWRAWRHRAYSNAWAAIELFEMQWVDGNVGGEFNRTVYTCRAYDSTSGLCTAHELRPAICYDYPLYDDPVPQMDRVARKFVTERGASCSYWLDMPGWSGRGARPLLPVEVLS